VFTGPSNGTPNIQNLYLRLSNISTAISIAINSDPKVEVSTVFCPFENHVIGEQLRKIRIPV
jgi:hypothetical protein